MIEEGMNENYLEDIEKLREQGHNVDIMTGYELACLGAELFPNRPIPHPEWVWDEAIAEHEKYELAKALAETKALNAQLKELIKGNKAS